LADCERNIIINLSLLNCTGYLHNIHAPINTANGKEEKTTVVLGKLLIDNLDLLLSLPKMKIK
jgi:hypothetical protein